MGYLWDEDEDGICDVCGCTDCLGCIDEVTHLPCSWANEEHTLCTACQGKIERGEIQ